MPKVKLNIQASDFTLNDFNEQAIQLSDFYEKKHVVLIFNRGFI